ncbi:MAG: methionyl-tRNA formyltransferase [Planctomycetota bacterium]|jgi:methionyl-tRNA formyltransferase
MKVVYLGSGQFGLDCLNAISESAHGLDFIVTQLPLPAGRGKKNRPTPVARWSHDHSVPFLETDNVNALPVVQQIAEIGPDLILVIAFGQKVGNELIDLPPKGAINVHGSLLPKYRGAAPINWAIINGETKTGISIIALAEKMDAGDIIAQAETNIGTDESAGELHDRLAQIAAPLLIKTLDQIESGAAVYARQDHSKATLAPKLKKSDGFLDFADAAHVLRREILGLWPWPGAAAVYLSKTSGKSQRVIVAMAHVAQTSKASTLAPGTLDENLNIVCGKDALKITQIKPAGASLMNFKAFVNGRQTRPGDAFSKIENQTGPTV